MTPPPVVDKTRWTLSDEGAQLIKRHEGLRLTVYADTAGFKTIGFGHKLLPSRVYPAAITTEQAETLLKDDLAIAQAAVRRLVAVPLREGQFAALVSFTFNLGAAALAASTLLRKLNAGDYAGASREFARWVHAGGRKLEGLVSRRADERALFDREGPWL